MTQTELDSILNDSVFSDCIKDAAPYRVKIIQDYTPRMKEIQDEYIKLMTDADYKNVSAINAKLKLDKKDETAKLEYKNWKKGVMKLFRVTLKSIHPNENQVVSPAMVLACGRLLKYIGRDDIVSTALADTDSDVTFKPFEEIAHKFADPNIKTRMTYIFEQADETQGEICAAADEIKKTIYDALPANVKFDSKENRSGIKPPHFQKLVRHKAFGLIRDADKYTKYIKTQLAVTQGDVDREEIMLGKTEQM